MALFPEPTNAQYTGSRISLVILGLAVVLTIIPACIHTFLPDGGANIIAGLGLDLSSEHGRQVVSMFAWAGTTQLVWGLILLTILLKYRSLVPLALGLLTFERVLHCWHLWGPKSGGQHPPEAYATLILIPLFALGLILALRTPK
ncbi:MAG: hypothetical protein ABJG15_16185 [Hyphomonadaceae bacterium]